MSEVIKHIVEVVVALLTMRPLPEGWRTTLAGVAAWVYVAVVLLRVLAGTGGPGELIEALLAAIVGSGLIAAEDAKWEAA
jgi:hypothetical protein